MVSYGVTNMSINLFFDLIDYLDNNLDQIDTKSRFGEIMKEYFGSKKCVKYFRHDRAITQSNDNFNFYYNWVTYYFKSPSGTSEPESAPFVELIFNLNNSKILRKAFITAKEIEFIIKHVYDPSSSICLCYGSRTKKIYIEKNLALFVTPKNDYFDMVKDGAFLDLCAMAGRYLSKN